jgi:hypothetical protein
MRRRCLTLALLVVLAAPAAAQVTETPLAFDSAGRVPTITQGLAERLRLAPPAWPVLGSFVNARLFARSDSGYTLVVLRGNGSFDRYALDANAAEALRSVVRTALASGRRAGLGEQTDLFSDPAGNAFVRNQALLGVLIYGPAAATALSGNGDPSLAAATELIVSGGAFFAALARRNHMPPVTTAQNILATHMATRGAAFGAAVAYVGDADASAAGLSILAGSVGGTIGGMARARRMTDAEAAASGLVADATALTSLGIMGAAGLLDEDGRNLRGALGIASAALVTGYVIGPAYPRRARYTVTAGDASALRTSAALGMAIAATPFMDGGRHDEASQYAALTAGMLGGLVLGDRFLVRPRDHSRSEGTLLWTGATAGALVGAGVAAAGDASGRTTWIIGTSGALLGLVATEAAIRPAPGGWNLLGGSRAADAGVSRVTGRRASRVDVQVDPIGAVFAARSKRGRFPVMRVSF